jgi:hypothetical protein
MYDSTVRELAISIAAGMPNSADSRKPQTVAIVVGTAWRRSSAPSVQNVRMTS